MSRIVIALFSFLLLVPQGLRATLQLQNAVISKVAPSTTACTAPPQATTFSATDTAVYVYFDVSGVNVGDTFTVAFFGPSGQFYTGVGGESDWKGATSAGEWCYNTTNAPWLIAGNPAATMPGTWTVGIYYNTSTTAFASGTFTITAGTGTCTYSLDKTSAPAGSGASTGSFQVTATPSTCAWTATSSAPSWLTTSSSGNGSGTVNYTVAAT